MRVLTGMVAAALLVVGSAAATLADGGRIAVGRSATVADEAITLADVATLEGEAVAFGGVVLGPAPAPGASRGIDGRTILRRLRDAGFDASRTRYVIPPSVRIARAAQEISSEEIKRAVENAGPTLLRPGERIRSLELSHPVRVPLGDYALQVVPPRAELRGTNRRFDVEVVVDARVVTTASVQARIDAVGPVVVARRPIARGAIVQADDLTVEERDLGTTSANVVSSIEQATGMQARVPLTAGTALTFRALENPLLVRRGDLVTVVVETFGMRLSVPGEVQEHGAEGESVRVVNLKSQQELAGRVVDRGVVLVHY